MLGINCDGVFDDVGMIESVIVMMNELEVKGVQNMKIIFECISRLDALKKAIYERREDGGDVSAQNKR